VGGQKEGVGIERTRVGEKGGRQLVNIAFAGPKGRRRRKRNKAENKKISSNDSAGRGGMTPVPKKKWRTEAIRGKGGL